MTMHAIPTSAAAGLSHPSTLGSWLTELWFRQESASEIGRYSDGLFLFIFWVSVFSVVLIIGLMARWTW